jgi:hypothetical protein
MQDGGPVMVVNRQTNTRPGGLVPNRNLLTAGSRPIYELQNKPLIVLNVNRNRTLRLRKPVAGVKPLLIAFRGNPSICQIHSVDKTN